MSKFTNSGTKHLHTRLARQLSAYGEATLRYFKTALQKKHNNSLFIFDDIYWSAGMTKAWEEIKNHTSVTLSIDTFYFGLIFFKEEIKEKRELKIWI
ncbi:MAG: hypothetical protein KF900_09185 [Bacteroidetes bacterium]|nr:hypothetical protein [Bacteroidota bacterium]